MKNDQSKDPFFETDRNKITRSGVKSNKINPELLRRLRDGDHLAFQTIYLHSIDSMRDFLNLLLHSREQAEDLAQEIFARVWERRLQIDPQADFKAYLFMVTKWAALNYLDHKKVEQKYHEFVSNFRNDTGPATDDNLICEELALVIKLSLERMPAKQRQVFELSRFEGKSGDEIAALLNMSPTTVRVHLHNALKQLKDVITLFITLFFS